MRDDEARCKVRSSLHSSSDSKIDLIDITKRFGGAQGLSCVNLSILSGEIHGLVGENGAGKSTLGRLIQGAFPPDNGEIWISGRRVAYKTPRDAMRDGIAGVAQELSLVPQLSVRRNVLL